MRFTFVLIVMCFMPALAVSATYYVPTDFPTIQQAVDATVNFDIIIVRPGTYVENVVVSGKHISIISEQGPDVTVIDGNAAGTVVTFSSAHSRLDGFTITHGEGQGGGIFLIDSDAEILNNVIMWNVGYDNGGGINVYKYSAPKIYNNIIINNKAVLGGGMYIFHAKPLVANNMIVWNKCIDYGAGISCDVQSKPYLIHNTVFGNSAQDGGGGLHCRDGCEVQVHNSIFWKNDAPKGQEIWVGDSTNPSTVDISHSDVAGGAASVVVEAGCTLNWGAGMINADPLFVDPGADDFHITYPSPCRDAGDNNLFGIPPFDFEYDPRLAYQLVDMGADEFSLHLYYTGSATPSGTVQMKFVGHPGTVQVGLLIGLQIFDPPLPSAFGDWYIKPPPLIIVSPLGPVPANGVFVLPGTLPAAPPGPYTIYTQALIGWQLTNLCTLHVQ